MEKMLVSLGYDLGQDALDTLRTQFTNLDFVLSPRNERPDPNVAKNARILLNYGDKHQIAWYEDLRYIHTISAGIDGYIDEVNRVFGDTLPVTNGAGVYGISVGEHAIALLMSLLYSIKPCVHNMNAQTWKNFPIRGHIAGSTVGILGTGDIGNHVATALSAMGATLLGYKYSPCAPFAPYKTLYTGEQGLAQMLPQCDSIIICLPGTPFTHNLLDEKALHSMKKGVFIVNIGRGSIIDTDALLSGLRSGHIAGAGLDVTQPEPLPAGHPLWTQENTIITPHISGMGASKLHHALWFAQNLQHFLIGTPQPGAVNRQLKY